MSISDPPQYAATHDHVTVVQLPDGELVGAERREVLGILGAELQEPLQPRRTVLRALWRGGGDQ